MNKQQKELDDAMDILSDRITRSERAIRDSQGHIHALSRKEREISVFVEEMQK